MNDTEEEPLSGWTALEHLWDDIADAWFKLDRDRPTYMFRVPQLRLSSLTVEDLLKAAAIPSDDVESWQFDNAPDLGDGTNTDLSHPLPLPPPDATHLTVYVRMKPPTEAAISGDSREPDVTPEQWQALDAIWRAIVSLEASLDITRLSMDSLRAEMETAFHRPLAVEEKVHALQADVAQWTKAKSRVHYALPKVREFIHRATWAAAAPERKAVEELVRVYIEPRVAPPRLDPVRERLEHLQKDRQVLLGQGNSVSQEGRAILAEVQRSLSTLQRNAADRARKDRDTRRAKGKSF